MNEKIKFSILILLLTVFLLSCSSPFESVEVTIPSNTYFYTGDEIKPEVTVTDGKTKLVEGRDYTVNYRNNKDVGTAEVTVNGKGDYDIKETKEFQIVKSIELEDSQYNEYIEGEVTKDQLTGILNLIMDLNSNYQTIHKEQISVDYESTSIFPLVKELTSYEEAVDEQDKCSCSIDEINQKLSSFTDFKFTPDTTYQSASSDNDLYTDESYLHMQPKGQATQVSITSAKIDANKMEVAFRYTGVYDNFINQEGNNDYESRRKMSEKYVAVLKKQSDSKYKLVQVSLKDTYGMKIVPQEKYKELIQGEISREQLGNVLSAVMWSSAKWDGTTRTINKKKISEAGKQESTTYLVVHALAFGGGNTRIEEANRILSAFTSFKYERNSTYKDADNVHVKTNRDEVDMMEIPLDGIHEWVTIKTARYSAEKMVVLFTYCYYSDREHNYNYKAILKKDNSKKFKLVKIEKTIPRN